MSKRRRLDARKLSQAQSAGLTDPRNLSGGTVGPGGPHDRGMVLLDTRDAVLMEGCEVATMDAVRGGVIEEQIIFMTLSGRINKSPDRAKVGFLFDCDGAAGIITELLALADRFGAELMRVLIRRLVILHREGNVDLRVLKAVIDAAIEIGGGEQ